MGCQSAKVVQPEAQQLKPAQEPVPTQEALKAEESKTTETTLVEDEPREDESAHKLSPGGAVVVAEDGGTPAKLHREVAVGSAVTTTGGLSGTVVRIMRSQDKEPLEVCLQTEDGEEKWCGIEDIMVVSLTIVRATALRNADWLDKSDPYVVCQIEGRPATVQTPTVVDNLDPVWNYQASLLGFQKGDSLKFKIWDSDSFKRDDFLGAATLSGDSFLESCFEGQLPLTNKEGKPTVGTLTVKVSVQPAPAESPAPGEEQEEQVVAAEPQKTEPEVPEARHIESPAPGEDDIVVADPQKIEAEVSSAKQKPAKGWCCC